MNKLSRLQPIVRSEAGPLGGGLCHAVRVVVDETSGADTPQVTLSPGDRLIVENRTRKPLSVAPLDFFGNAFGRFTLSPGQASGPMVVTGLWFQVELHLDGRRFFPLDVYLAPNGVE